MDSNKIKKRNCKPRSVNQNELIQMIEDYNNGLSTVKIANKYNMKASAVRGRLVRAGIKLRSNKVNSRKYLINHNAFNNIDNEEKAYWLGFLYADGYLNSDSNQFGISLSIKDINHLEKFKKFMNTDCPIRIYNANKHSYSNNQYCRLLLSSDQVKDDLIKHGCCENKTLILDKPKISYELIKHFIRGYFDGDGCITICHMRSKNREYNMCKVTFVGTEKLLNFINEWVFTNLGFKMKTLTKRRQTDQVFSLEYSSNKRSKAFLDAIYKDATVYLDRKHEKYIEWFYNKVEPIRNDRC